jgi:NADH dehydrogenase
LERPEAAGQTYSLGGPRAATFRALMELMLAEIGRKRWLVPIPFALASFKAFFLERLPNPLLTRDQVKLLRRDTVVPPGAPGLEALGIVPTSLELVLPTYLNRFRRGGRLTAALSVH